MKVRFTRRAQADVDAIFKYLDERSPRGSDKVKFTLTKTASLIANYPHIGRRSGEQDTRVIPVGHYPYLIYWSIEVGQAVIVHIRHESRRPWQDEF